MRSRYVDIEDRTQDLAEGLKEAQPEVRQDFLNKYELSWLYHENALEGVVYSGRELEEGLALASIAEATAMAALRDVRNLEAAIEVVRAEAKVKRPKITLALVKKLYDTLNAGYSGRQAGEYRKDIPLHRAYFHEIAPPVKIPALLEKLVEGCEAPEFKNMHPIQAASWLGHGFMQVYPYTDGPGKISRLLSNLVLLQHDYFPCIIHTIDRQRYYEALRFPESHLRDLMLESMQNGLANGEKFFREARGARARKVVR